MIGKAKHLKTSFGQVGVTLGIMLPLLVEAMLVAIDFDDQASAEVDEICNIRAKRHLPTEMTSIRRQVLSHGSPKSAFRLGQTLA